MRKLLSILVVVVALAGAMIAIPVFAEDVTAVVDLDPAAFEFPEGLAVDADGNIYFGLAPTGELARMLAVLRRRDPVPGEQRQRDIVDLHRNASPCAAHP